MTIPCGPVGTGIVERIWLVPVSSTATALSFEQTDVRFRSGCGLRRGDGAEDECGRASGYQMAAALEYERAMMTTVNIELPVALNRVFGEVVDADRVAG